MNYKIYIQALNNFPIADWAVSAYLGFKERQADIYLFENIEEVPRQRNVILVAFIEDTNKWLADMGIPPKMALNIPEALSKDCFVGRLIWTTWLGWYRKMNERLKTDKLISGLVDPYPVFVKPAGRAKEFVAGVVRSEKDLDLFFHDLPNETRLFCSEVVDFVSEYRVFVCEGRVLGIKHYLGDFFTFPDTELIKAMVDDYRGAPAGYSLDVGVLQDGRTVLVECNDGWSLGNYGLDPNLYVRLLVARWRELMKPINQSV